MYDYLIVGAGLYGAVFGRAVAENGKKVLLIDRRTEIGGNVRSEEFGGVHVHRFGPHIFHTNDDGIWAYVNRFATFNNYVHRPKAKHGGKLYSLPFNLMTFYQLWGTQTPEEARLEVERQKVRIENPKNLEEWALSQVGPEVYDKLVYGYTKKQWMREPRDLPASILKRIPIRYTYDDNYFDDRHQGIPVGGYSQMVANIVDGLEVRLGEEFRHNGWRRVARNLVYSGPIDQFFDYCYGDLEYRTLRFQSKVVEGDFQGVSIVNYTEESVPYTRITEHKHFHNPKAAKSVITYEYPVAWGRSEVPYYPINDEKNNALYERYRALSKKVDGLIVGGRLGRFRYYDMHQVIGSALADARQVIGTA